MKNESKDQTNETKALIPCAGGCGKLLGELRSWVCDGGKTRYCEMCFRSLKKDSQGRPS